MGRHSVLPLSQLEVLVVDCQATAAAPRGHLLEIGWARACTALTHAHARLIALPDRERIPPAVARITISERMLRDAVQARLAWRELSDEAARLPISTPSAALAAFAMGAAFVVTGTVNQACIESGACAHTKNCWPRPAWRKPWAWKSPFAARAKAARAGIDRMS